MSVTHTTWFREPGGAISIFSRCSKLLDVATLVEAFALPRHGNHVPAMASGTGGGDTAESASEEHLAIAGLWHFQSRHLCWLKHAKPCRADSVRAVLLWNPLWGSVLQVLRLFLYF